MTPEWPHPLNCQKLPEYNEHLPPDAQISLLFALRSLVFQIIEILGFPIGYKGAF